MEAYFRLRPRLQRFVDAYVELGVGSEAMRRCDPSLRRPAVAASKLLARDDVRAAVQERSTEAMRASGVRLERVLEELARVAFFNPQDLLDPTTGQFLPIHRWPRAAAAAIAGMDVEALYAGSGKDRIQIGDILKPRAVPKNEALKMLLQHLGGLTEKHEHSGPGGGPIRQQITSAADLMAAATDDNEAARIYANLMS